MYCLKALFLMLKQVLPHCLFLTTLVTSVLKKDYLNHPAWVSDLRSHFFPLASVALVRNSEKHRANFKDVRSKKKLLKNKGGIGIGHRNFKAVGNRMYPGR